MVIICLNPELNTYIVDDCDDYKSSQVDSSYLCFRPIIVANTSNFIKSSNGTFSFAQPFLKVV